MRGHDWLALFTPSERPIAPSRVSLRLGSPPSLSAGCDRCPTPARPHPAPHPHSTPAPSDSPGSLHSAPRSGLLAALPTCDTWTYPTVASNSESRSTAIIVLALTSTSYIQHFLFLYNPYSTFDLCLHFEVHIDIVFCCFCASIHPRISCLALLSPVVQGPELPIRFVYCPHKSGNETRRRNPPCASTCSIEPRLSACPPVATRPKSLQGPARSSPNPPIRSRLFTLRAPESIPFPSLDENTDPNPIASISSPPPLSPTGAHRAPSTAHRALRTEYRAPSADTEDESRKRRQLPIAANRFPAVRGRNESMSTAN